MIFDKYKLKGAYHYEWLKSELWYRACVDRCVKFCKGTTLDVGCGDGVVSNYVAENGHYVTGIDNSEEAIELAKTHSRGEFFVHDVTKLLKGKWEYMVCLNVIEHLEDPKAIKRIFDHNITKAAIIITDTPQANPSPYHYKEFTSYELKQLFPTRKVVQFKINDDFHGIEVYK